jgi:hypothetical protein
MVFDETCMSGALMIRRSTMLSLWCDVLFSSLNDDLLKPQTNQVFMKLPMVIYLILRTYLWFKSNIQC